jgi:iron complex outermembrane receptor protein
MKKTILLFALFVLTFQLGFSQQKSDSTSINLSDVEVNANRNKLYSEMGRILTVIDKTEITRSAVQSLDQLLDYVAGIDIRQRGTNTTQADISVRGGSFDQVLVLLNGVNITDPQTGHFNLDIPLNLSDVSRVEILQGSSARILGSNAFSGAINIITENGQQNTLKAELTGGSYTTFGQSVVTTVGNDKLHTLMSVSHRASDGYMRNTDYDFTNAFVQSVLNTKSVGKFDLQLAAQQKAFGANEFYGLAYPNQYERSKTLFTALNWSFTHNKLAYSAQTYWRRHNDRFELDYNKSSGWNYHQTDVTGAKFTIEALSSLGKTMLGTELRNEHILSNKLGEVRDSLKVPFEESGYFTKETNRLNSSAFLNHSIAFGKFYASAGVSGTYTSKYGLNGAGGADIAYRFSDKYRVFASFNSAVRLPTFTDIYYLIPSFQVADPNIKPEHSQTLELGTKLNESNWKFEATAYYRMGQNVIDWILLPGETVWKNKNLTNVNAIGVDVTTEYLFQNCFIRKIGVAYSYLAMDKDASTFDSKYALDYLKNKAVVSLDHKVTGKLSASWKLAYFDRAGSYTDIKKALQYFTPYTNMDCRLLWNDKHFDIFADANNILNITYADYGGLTQPGINFNVGLRLKLK